MSVVGPAEVYQDLQVKINHRASPLEGKNILELPSAPSGVAATCSVGLPPSPCGTIASRVNPSVRVPLTIPLTGQVQEDSLQT